MIKKLLQEQKIYRSQKLLSFQFDGLENSKRVNPLSKFSQQFLCRATP